MNSTSKTFGTRQTVEFQGKVLRCGHTTGSCATAAAKACLIMYLTGEKVHEVMIDTPSGESIWLPVEEIRILNNRVSCAVRKDGGDDPDATHNLLIYVELSVSEKEGVSFEAGEGVGMITKPGLYDPPGSPAINPVPRAMIVSEFKKVLLEHKKDPDSGFHIKVSIPGGETIAKRTFNPKLGIEGGLSILGTKGIVYPMSEDALKQSIVLEISMRREQFKNTDLADTIIFVPGNYGQEFAKTLGLPEERMVRISNFVGEMFDEAEKIGISRILLIGEIGKFVKVASGIYQTHSKMADGRMMTLIAAAALCDAPKELIEKIYHSNTTSEACEYIREAGINCIFERLVHEILYYCTRRANQQIEFECILFEKGKGELARSKGASEMIDILREEK